MQPEYLEKVTIYLYHCILQTLATQYREIGTDKLDTTFIQMQDEFIYSPPPTQGTKPLILNSNTSWGRGGRGKGYVAAAADWPRAGLGPESNLQQLPACLPSLHLSL